MSYIGYKPVQGNVVVDEFTSTGGSTYTLSSQPTNNNWEQTIFINNSNNYFLKRKKQWH